jgi:ureidoglycolate lyase
VTRLLKVRVEPLTETSFAPFGELLEAKQKSPDISHRDANGWHVAFDLQSTTAMMVFRNRYRGLQCTVLERHLSYGQTFVLLSGSPAVVAVAPATQPDAPQDVPLPDDVRAFLIEGPIGYVVHKGVWHSAGRFPLYGPYSDFLVITADPAAKPPSLTGETSTQLTERVDYSISHGVTLELTL